MAVKFSNNASTTLSAGISSGVTSFQVASNSGFPTLGGSDWTYVTIDTEVVKVTAISGTTFTCDTTGEAHSNGDNVELRMTAELLNDFAEDTEALPLAGGTMTGDLNLGDDVDINFGDSGDLKIYHDAGGNSYVYESGSGSLVIKATDLYLNSTADEAMASFIENGAASLMYDTATKLATTDVGIDVTGRVWADSANIRTDQNAISQVNVQNDTSDTSAGAEYKVTYAGGSGVLRGYSAAYTSTSAQYIADSLLLEADNATGGLVLSSNDGGNIIRMFTADVERMQVSSSGIAVTGNINGLAITTTATSNIGLGTNTVDSITIGDYNVGIGDNALTANTEGYNNVAIGYNALTANTTGYSQTAIGYRALHSVVSTNRNTAVGYDAGRHTTGYYNTFVGAQAGLGAAGNNAASCNIGIGTQALQAVTTGGSNVGIGAWTGGTNAAIAANTTGGSNIAIGTEALGRNTTASYNTAVGRGAL